MIVCEQDGFELQFKDNQAIGKYICDQIFSK